MHILAKLGQENLLRVVRRVRWHCPQDTGFKIQPLEICVRARYLSVTELHHNTEFYEWMGKKHSLFLSNRSLRPGNEPRTLAWKAAVLTTTLAPPSCTYAISRQKEARSRDYAIALISNDFKGPLQWTVGYHRQHCTLHAFEKNGALYRLCTTTMTNIRPDRDSSLVGIGYKPMSIRRPGHQIKVSCRCRME